MAAYDLTEGQVIDGFRLDGALDPGGMANFWRVSRTEPPRTEPAPARNFRW